MKGLELRIAPSRSSAANPLPIDGSQLWTRNNVHFTVGRDEAGAWYGWMEALRAADGAPDARVTFRVISEDGLAWKRSGDALALPSPAAIVFDEADAEAKHRYKAIVSGWAELDSARRPLRVVDKQRWTAEGGANNAKLIRGIFSCTSSDGVQWGDFHRVVTEELGPGKRWWTPGTPGWAGGDNFPCLLYAPDRQKWVAFFRTNIDPGPRGGRRERAIGRAESADFQSWSAPDLTLHAQTPKLTALGHAAQDYYQLQAWPCGGGYLGLLSVFYWQEDRVHLELAWSPNTLDWERVCPGADLIPHGDRHQPGGGCRYGAMTPISIGDDVRVYWGGDDGKHNANPDRKGYVFLNEFKRDRFAGYAVENPAVGGELRLRPIRLTSASLHLNADAREGDVRVELLDSKGQTLPGFTLADSEIFHGDSLSASLRWKNGDTLQLTGRDVVLRLVVRGSVTLYAIGASRSSSAAAP